MVKRHYNYHCYGSDANKVAYYKDIIPKNMNEYDNLVYDYQAALMWADYESANVIKDIFKVYHIIDESIETYDYLFPNDEHHD